MVVAVNGQTNKVRNTRVSTVKGNKNHHNQPHSGSRIAQAGSGLNGLQNVSVDGVEFVSLTDSDDSSLASAQVVLVAFNIYCQIGVDTFGDPIFAQVTFQMDLFDFLAMIGGNGNGFDSFGV